LLLIFGHITVLDLYNIHPEPMYSTSLHLVNYEPLLFIIVRAMTVTHVWQIWTDDMQIFDEC